MVDCTGDPNGFALMWCYTVCGRFEATVSEDGTLRVWDIASQRVIAVFSDDTIFHNCVWAEDGLTLAVTDYRKRTHLLRLFSHAVRN